MCELDRRWYRSIQARDWPKVNSIWQ